MLLGKSLVFLRLKITPKINKTFGACSAPVCISSHSGQRRHCHNAHSVQVLEMSTQCCPKTGIHGVGNTKLLTCLLDNRGQRRVMCVVDPWEQMMHHLVIKATTDVRPKPRAMCKVGSGGDLRLCPPHVHEPTGRVTFDKGHVAGDMCNLKSCTCETVGRGGGCIKACMLWTSRQQRASQLSMSYLKHKREHPSNAQLACEPQQQQPPKAVWAVQEGQHNKPCCKHGLAAPEDERLMPRHGSQLHSANAAPH